MQISQADRLEILLFVINRLITKTHLIQTIQSNTKKVNIVTIVTIVNIINKDYFHNSQSSKEYFKQFSRGY